MIGRVVEVATDGCYLNRDRGFMTVSRRGMELGRVPLDDMSALILSGHGLVHSSNLITALVERGCPVVLCGNNHKPVGIVWAVEAHHLQSARMDAQMAAGRPLKKRLWQRIVRLKIGMQAAALELVGGPAASLRRMAEKVQSGDPGNVEGQAARVYWPALMGKGFRRDPDGDGANALLNYGYAVIRAMVARHVMAAGLHPGVALQHANESNAMRLVDDLMEPFRPMVDVVVHELGNLGALELNQRVKSRLALIPATTLRGKGNRSPVAMVCERWCQSVTQVLMGKQRELNFPEPSTALLKAVLAGRADGAS